MVRIPLLLSILFIIYFSGCNSLNKKTDNSDQNISGLDSVEIITNLISRDSTNYTLYKKRASLFLERGNLDPALRDIGSAIDMNREDPELFVMLGDIYFIIGQTDNAITSYKRAVALDPKLEKPILKLAETYIVLQQYDLALRYLDGAISTNVNSSKAFYLKGILKLETGDTLSALTNMKIAINVDSSNYEALMQTGGLLLSKNDSSASDYYKAVLKNQQTDESAMFFLALSYQNMGKFDIALDIYNEIGNLYPNNKSAFFNAGYIYLVEVLDFENAVRSFQTAIVIDPSYVEAVYNLGRTYEEMGRYDDARIQYTQAMELVSNYPLAIDGLNRLDEIQYSN